MPGHWVFPLLPHLRAATPSPVGEAMGPAGAENHVLASRVEELSEAFREAAKRTERSCLYNRERLTQGARAENITVGDTIAIRAMEGAPLDPKWDHGYVVTRVRGSVVTAVGPGNRRRTVNRCQVRLVDAEAAWEELRPRQTRTQRLRDLPWSRNPAPRHCQTRC